jgi:hypothetical protein
MGTLGGLCYWLASRNILVGSVTRATTFQIRSEEERRFGVCPYIAFVAVAAAGATALRMPRTPFAALGVQWLYIDALDALGMLRSAPYFNLLLRHFVHGLILLLVAQDRRQALELRNILQANVHHLVLAILSARVGDFHDEKLSRGMGGADQ